MTIRAITLGLAMVSVAVYAGNNVKLIAHGWDLLDVSPEEVLAHADAFDKTQVDGVTLCINRTLANGRRISHGNVMNDSIWPREELADVIPVFREIVKHPSLRESFVSSWWQPPKKRLLWTDDAAWAAFAANMGTVAWLAKQGGLRGVLVDGEDYPKARQYVRLEGDPDYDTAAKLARQRGRQVFGAIFKEFPDVTFLSFWLLSITPEYFIAEDPVALARSKNDLWPSFLNGMLDVLPPEARFVDGNEHAYRYKAEKRDFYVSACRQRKNALGLIAPENRAKYRRSLCAGFGLYLDSYTTTNTASQWYLEPLHGSRLAHFRVNLEQAMEAADAYVWVYGEQRAWVPWKGLKKTRFVGKPTWDDALPGFTDMMAGVKNPLAYIDRKFGEGCEAKNLFPNGMCTGVKGAETNGLVVGKLPAGWSIWIGDKKRAGIHGTENGATCSSLRAEGALGGSFITKLNGVKPGETYAVVAHGRGTNPNGMVCWQKDGKWDWTKDNINLVFKIDEKDAWRRGRALVRVPEGVNSLVLQLGINLNADETVRYSKVSLYRIP